MLFFREKNVRIEGTYESKSKFYTSKTNREDKKKYLHPTIKPLDFTEKLVLNSSFEGDIVLDPFIGSGTTAVAAKNLNRKYIGFEKNKKYFQIALDRLDGYTQIEREERNNGVMNLFDDFGMK